VKWIFSLTNSDVNEIEFQGSIIAYFEELNDRTDADGDMHASSNFMIDDGSEVNIRIIRQPTKSRQHPLYLACANGHTQVAVWLILHGALYIKDVDQQQQQQQKQGSRGLNPHQHGWKVDKNAFIRDIVLSKAEPFLRHWCKYMIKNSGSFRYFVFACCMLGNRKIDSDDYSVLRKIAIARANVDEDPPTDAQPCSCCSSDSAVCVCTDCKCSSGTCCGPSSSSDDTEQSSSSNDPNISLKKKSSNWCSKKKENEIITEHSEQKLSNKNENLSYAQSNKSKSSSSCCCKPETHVDDTSIQVAKQGGGGGKRISDFLLTRSENEKERSCMGGQNEEVEQGDKLDKDDRPCCDKVSNGAKNNEIVDVGSNHGAAADDTDEDDDVDDASEEGPNEQEEGSNVGCGGVEDDVNEHVGEHGGGGGAFSGENGDLEDHLKIELPAPHGKRLKGQTSFTYYIPPLSLLGLAPPTVFMRIASFAGVMYGKTLSDFSNAEVIFDEIMMSSDSSEYLKVEDAEVILEEANET
jgi:hypothetical protein